MSNLSVSMRIQAMQSVMENPHLLDASENESWTMDKEIVKTAILVYPFAIRYAPYFQGDKDLGLLAVRINGLNRFFLSKELRNNQEIAELAEANMPKEYRCPPSGKRLMWLQRVHENLTKELQQMINIDETCIPLQLPERNISVFLRDPQLPLHSNKLLIPYNLKDKNLSLFLSVILPHYFRIFRCFEEGREEGMLGTGLLPVNTDHAMVKAYDLGISFVRKQSSIEGGNYIPLKTKDNKIKVLIGDMTLYLTMCGLREQGMYKHIPNLPLRGIGEPSEESVKITKYFMEYCNQHPPFANYYASEISLFDDARKVEGQLRLAKIAIFEDLEINSDNLVVMPQTQFHIDEEILAIPSNGEVILHDDALVDNFLEDIRKSTSNIWTEEEMALCNQYRNHARQRAEEFKDIREKQRQALEKAGIVFHNMPLVFQAEEKGSCLNYCNGIFVKNSQFAPPLLKDEGRENKAIRGFGVTFITTGPSKASEKKIHDRFIALFQEKFPDITIKSIEGISSFMSEYSGGIRCLTLETEMF